MKHLWGSIWMHNRGCMSARRRRSEATRSRTKTYVYPERHLLTKFLTWERHSVVVRNWTDASPQQDRVKPATGVAVADATSF